jgi:hypothetical protein
VCVSGGTRTRARALSLPLQHSTLATATATATYTVSNSSPSMLLWGGSIQAQAKREELIVVISDDVSE